MDVLENRAGWETAFREGWLAHYRQTGEFDWQQYTFPRNRTAPSGPGVDLAISRLMLVSSAGVYLRGEQPPFDATNALGDYSVRLVPHDTEWSRLAISHDHYDHAAVEEDPEVLWPLGHLANLVMEGEIGSLAPSVVSFMGYQPNAAQVVDETVPAVVSAAQREEVGAVLLVPA